LVFCAFVWGYDGVLLRRAESDSTKGQYDYSRWLMVYPGLLMEWYPFSFAYRAEESMRWLEKAAESGEAVAMWALGVRLTLGQVPGGRARAEIERGDAWMEAAIAKGFVAAVPPSEFYWSVYRRVPW